MSKPLRARTHPAFFSPSFVWQSTLYPQHQTTHGTCYASFSCAPREVSNLNQTKKVRLKREPTAQDKQQQLRTFNRAHKPNFPSPHHPFLYLSWHFDDRKNKLSRFCNKPLTDTALLTQVHHAQDVPRRFHHVGAIVCRTFCVRAKNDEESPRCVHGLSNQDCVCSHGGGRHSWGRYVLICISFSPALVRIASHCFFFFHEGLDVFGLYL